MIVDDCTIDGCTIQTARLRLRRWELSDAPRALDIYSDERVARWVAPALARVPDQAEMERLISGWRDSEDPATGRPIGHWAIDELATGALVGAAQIVALPPQLDDLEIGYQLARAAWGHGLGAEAGHALAHYAFHRGEEEVYAVVRPKNQAGIATARNIGMDWVGETDKYYNLRLQIYRLRKGDLDRSPLEPSHTEYGPGSTAE